MKIIVAKDFSATPGGRFRTHGPFSGEEFRQDLLLPRFDEARQKGEKLEIDFDNVVGLPSSFLEEAFGGLVRDRSALSIDQLTSTLSLMTSDRSLDPYLELVGRYIKEAAKRPTPLRQ